MKIALISALGLALAATSVSAEASGSGSGSRGGFGSGIGGGSSLDNAATQEERIARRGRSQVRKHITCKNCEYHDRLNNRTAAEVARSVRNGEFNIKQKDRSAVLFYLRNRYGV